MSKTCRRCLIQKLERQNKQLRIANAALLACCLDLRSDLNDTHWTTDEITAATLRDIVTQRWKPLEAAIALATAKEPTVDG